MKGKAKNKKKIGTIILASMGFFLAIVLTFTTTLAWFYDSDWANKYISMAGTVGIEIRDNEGHKLAGEGQLYFNLHNTELAYPGQSIEVQASAYNTGGRSGEKGSECYIRANFAVYTDIGNGKAPNVDDYKNETYPTGLDNPDYEHAMDEFNKGAEEEKRMTGDTLYSFLFNLIATQNALFDTTGYLWVFYQQSEPLALSDSGTGVNTSNESDIKYYMEGEYDTEKTKLKQKDSGYFYLCSSNDGLLKPLAVDESAVFLWNSTFIIPWQLTNSVADKKIYVCVTFQAIQTFIPKIGSDAGLSNGVISPNANNQLPADDCKCNNLSVQTVFNSCKFDPLVTTINIDGNIIDFGGDDYVTCNFPTDENLNSGGVTTITG